MNVVVASALLMLGFLLIVAEVFFPSLGALSILAVLALGGSVVFGFRESMSVGVGFLATAVLGGLGTALLAFKVFPKTPIGRRFILSGPSYSSDLAAVDEGARSLMGKQGIAATTLRPAGMAEIEGRRVDCVSEGEYLELGTPITVIGLDGNRVVVRRTPDRSPSATSEKDPR